jgi:hypothetical protein
VNLSARARANIVCVVAYLPYALFIFMNADKSPTRPMVYAGLAWALAVSVLCQWVYHRYLPRMPASAIPAPELSLAAERLPRVVWLAIIPPVITAVLLWCVLAYGSALPWRDTWLGPELPAPQHGFNYKNLVLTLVVWNCFAMWVVIFNLAMWHGMSRAYTYRRAGLVTAVAAQWLILVGTVGQAGGMSLRLPTTLATVSGIVYGASMAGVMWIGCEMMRRRKRAAEPRTGTWMYFDLRDPSFLGPRGVNTGNAWSWVLAGVGLAPLLLAEWMLHLARN